MTDATGPYGGGFSNDTAVELFNRLLDQRRPIVLGLTGARYCGKSHFTKRVAALLNNEKIPCAKVDVRERLGGQPEDLLDHLVVAFTDMHGPAVRFPRYLLARSVLAQRIDPPEPLHVRDRVHDVLCDTWRYDNLPALVGDLAGAVAELNGLPGTGIGDGMTRLARGITRTRAGTKIVQRPRASWFAKNELLEGATDATAGLARLWEWRHGGEWELGRSADRVLAAAFLADVRESAEDGRQRTNCGIVLDNADATEASVRLVRALVRVLGERDRATIAVTHRGDLLAQVGAVMGCDTVVDPVDVSFAESKGSPPEGTWWPLRLPDLDVAGIRDMLRETTSWNEWERGRAAKAVYGLTRGHLGTTTDVGRRLVERRAPTDGRIDLASLFDADVLIRRLTGPLDNTAALVTCSAVRDHDHVEPLFGDTNVGVVAAQRPELWVPSRAGGRLVLLPVLRRFLLRRFAERQADGPDGWETIFARLTKFSRDNKDEESELYYRLALGESEAVTRRLYERLSTPDPREWIELHKHVTLAPGRFGDGTDDVVLAEHTAWAADEETAVQALADLVVRLWLAADPFREPPLRRSIRDDYKDLARRFPTAAPLLLLEAAQWD